MLQIGHRLSYDFDCFSEQALPSTLIRKFHRVFGKRIRPHIDTGEVVSFKTGSQIETTFVCHPYRPLKPTIPSGAIPLFHLDDLVANKAYTIGRRGAWRDYVDLFTLLKWKLYSLERIITLTEAKFGVEFNPKLFLQQLTYFDDVEILPTVFLKESYVPNQIKTYLEHRVEAYIKKILP